MRRMQAEVLSAPAALPAAIVTPAHALDRRIVVALVTGATAKEAVDSRPGQHQADTIAGESVLSARADHGGANEPQAFALPVDRWRLRIQRPPSASQLRPPGVAPGHPTPILGRRMGAGTVAVVAGDFLAEPSIFPIVLIAPADEIPGRLRACRAGRRVAARAQAHGDFMDGGEWRIRDCDRRADGHRPANGPPHLPEIRPELPQWIGRKAGPADVLLLHRAR